MPASMGEKHGGGEAPAGESATTSTSWGAFTQSTTFHGVMYIFESTRFRTRRLLWTLCVLTAVAFFTIQVFSRSMAFSDHKTNTDVGIIYPRKVPFPAVTICNQNNFRLTQSVAFGLHDFVDLVYSADDLSELNVSQYNADLVETEDFIIAAAHQKEFFIERCSWQGKPCSIADDFETKITDLGVCYTFNSGRNSTVMAVEEPGLDFGLSLILNLEQYEYMKGPQRDAGVKILLHDQDDVPMMKGRGFAVAPGRHTLVGIGRSTVSRLEPPYGECSDLASPMAVCVTECKTRQVVAQCGCRHPYMANLTDEFSEICNMTSTFLCVQAASAKVRLGLSHCGCLLPCQTVTYKPSLSHARLSKYNIEKTTLPTEAQRQPVRERFLAALETSQRWVKDVAEADQRQMARIMSASYRLQEQLHLSRTHMRNTASLADFYQVMDVFQHGQHAFFVDYPGTFFITGSREWTDYRSRWTAQVRDTLNEFLAFMQITPLSTGSAFVASISDCMANDTIATTAASVTTDEMPEFEGGPDTPACDQVFESMEYYARMYSYKLIELYAPQLNSDTIPPTELFRTLHTYEGIIYEKFNGSHVDPHNFPEHDHCLESLQKTISKTAPAVQELFLLMKNMWDQSNSREDLFGKFTEMSSIIFSADLHHGWEPIAQKLEDCNWVQRNSADLGVGSRGEIDKYGRFNEIFYQLEDTFSPLKTSFAVLVSSLEKLSKLHEEKVGVVAEYLQLYLIGNSTKHDLALNILSKDFAKALKSYMKEMDFLSQKAVEFSSEVLSVSQSFRDGYGLLFQMIIPPFTDRVLMESSLWKDLLEPSRALQDLVTTYTDDRPANFDEMLAMLFQPFVEYPTQVVTQLEPGIRSLVSDVQDLQKSLGEYESSRNMDTQFYMENFLQVDIFYKEVSYRKVEQHAAFEFLSLLSEVGGFLGLLLGASVLTVCELVDYLVLLFVHKCRTTADGRTRTSK